MTRKRKERLPEEPQAPAKSEYSELVDIPKDINNGLSSMPGRILIKMIGGPYSKEVLERTHYVDVGPFKVEGLDPATKSLKEVMTIVEDKYPKLYPRLSQHGMRVPKNISGTSSPSLHTWGVAIDIKVDGVKDVRWNDKALRGLALIAPFFHEKGWYWGGAFRDKETKKGSGVYWSNEDAMHFEVSKEKLLEWAQTGLLGADAKKVARGIKVIRPGSKGPDVKRIQEALKKHYPATPTHGSYDRMTERAVKVVQAIFYMTPTGQICKELLKRLKIDYTYEI